MDLAIWMVIFQFAMLVYQMVTQPSWWLFLGYPNPIPIISDGKQREVIKFSRCLKILLYEALFGIWLIHAERSILVGLNIWYHDISMTN